MRCVHVYSRRTCLGMATVCAGCGSRRCTSTAACASAMLGRRANDRNDQRARLDCAPSPPARGFATGADVREGHIAAWGHGPRRRRTLGPTVGVPAAHGTVVWSEGRPLFEHVCRCQAYSVLCLLSVRVKRVISGGRGKAGAKLHRAIERESVWRTSLYADRTPRPSRQPYVPSRSSFSPARSANHLVCQGKHD